MIQINESLCSGCGVCVSACPQLAIFLIKWQAQIELQRCNECRDIPEAQEKLCVEACPNRALRWVEEKIDQGEVVVVPHEQKLVPTELAISEENQRLGQRHSEVMPRLGNVFKQVGEELIKELPTLLPNLIVSSSRREGKTCSSFGKQKHLRRRRHQRG